MSRTKTGRQDVAYPSPFFDIGQKYIPRNIKEIFKWTKYHYTSSSIVYPIVSKMSEYPVTSLIYSSKNPEAWKQIMEVSLKIRSFLVSVHEDLYVYGNAFALIHYPFIRYLKHGKDSWVASEVEYKIKFSNKKWHFHGKHPETGATVNFEYNDKYVANKERIKISKMDPANIDIDYNSYNGERHYHYNIPNADVKHIKNSKKVFLDSTPSIMFDAIAQEKSIQMSDNHFYHFERPSLAGLWPGWGTPALVPVLKDLHYYAIMRKANESLALQHIVPMLVLFPQANADITPYKSLNLSDWKSNVEGELAKWRKDPNYVPIMPIPLGQEMIGGNAKQYLVTQEADFVTKGIASGLGCPLSFLQGDLNYSGSSISLRVLENTFIKTREMDLEFINGFLSPRISRYYKMNSVEKFQFTPFKMADDVQFQQMMLNMTQNGLMSRKRFLDNFNINSDEEYEQMKVEHAQLASIQRDDMISQAEVQALSQSINMRSQAIAQFESQQITQDLQSEGNSNGNSEMNTQTSLLDVAQKYAAQISSMDPEAAEKVLGKMKEEMPHMYSEVQKAMQRDKQQQQQQQQPQEQEQQQSPVGGKLDAKPNPEQRPPRGPNASV